MVKISLCRNLKIIGLFSALYLREQATVGVKCELIQYRWMNGCNLAKGSGDPVVKLLSYRSKSCDFECEH